jgi:hypothetical protein
MAPAIIMSGGGGGGAILLAETMVIGGVILADIGVVRLVNNYHVDEEIKRRQTPLPAALQTGEAARLDLFFPLTPLPSRVEITYVEHGRKYNFDIDTRQALAAIHRGPASEPSPETNPSPR